MTTFDNIGIAADILGDITQVCCVTNNHKRTMCSLMKLGVGPWRIYNFNPQTTTETLYKGEPHSFSAVMGYANSANTQFEIVEPIGGTSIFADFLEQRGEGVHHFGIKPPKGRSVTEMITAFGQKSFPVAQSGRVWGGGIAFSFIDTFDELGFYLELTESSPGFQSPEPDEWYPAQATERVAL